MSTLTPPSLSILLENNEFWEPLNPKGLLQRLKKINSSIPNQDLQMLIGLIEENLKEFLSAKSLYCECDGIILDIDRDDSDSTLMNKLETFLHQLEAKVNDIKPQIEIVGPAAYGDLMEQVRAMIFSVIKTYDQQTIRIGGQMVTMEGLDNISVKVSTYDPDRMEGQVLVQAGLVIAMLGEGTVNMLTQVTGLGAYLNRHLLLPISVTENPGLPSLMEHIMPIRISDLNNPTNDSKRRALGF